uniref:Uncharacterized protein n=1 Tax=Helianthus annuus TaxID=4232 RepID=A0A251TFJ9_HELAN
MQQVYQTTLVTKQHGGTLKVIGRVYYPTFPFYPKDLSLPRIPTDCPNHRDACSRDELTFGLLGKIKYLFYQLIKHVLKELPMEISFTY